MTPTARPHGFVTKGIHWLSAGLLAYGHFKGLDNVRQLADPAVLQFEIIFALILGALFAVRLLWTKGIAGTTRLPTEAPKWEHVASRAVQVGLYASVFGIIISGLGIAFAFTADLGRGVTNAMVEFHEVTLALLPLFLIVHIAGALWHKVIRRDGVLESMTGPLPL